MSAAATDSSLGVLVGGSGFAKAPDAPKAFYFDMLDLDVARGGGARIALDFLAHGFAPDPRGPHRAALFEKRGPGACLVDLRERAVVATIEPEADRAYYGHGTFSRDGDVIFDVETVLSTGEGVVVVRDRDTHRPIEEFPTFGAKPHDCQLVDDGATLVITNGGGPVGDERKPCVCYVDAASRTLLERFDVDDLALNTGHIAVDGAGRFAVVSAPRDGLPEDTSHGALSLGRRGASWRVVREPEFAVLSMLGETLSVCIHEATGTVAATSPTGGSLTFWDVETGDLKRHVPLESPRGVTTTLDGRYFVVSFGESARLTLFRTSDLERLAWPGPSVPVFSGSHIYVREAA